MARNDGKGLGFWWLAVLIVVLIVMGIGGLVTWQRYLYSPVQQQSAMHVQQGLTLDDKVRVVVAEMSLKDKIGQMVMMGIDGTTLSHENLGLLRNYDIGGVVLYDRNMKSVEQVKSLTYHLQEDADEKIPLFIAVDEEGGTKVCMRGSLPVPPSAYSLGQANKPNEAEQWAFMTAKRLRDMGINANLAPVADLGSEGERHYSSDAAVVTTFVNAAATGYEHGKVMYALKHFPGLGSAVGDTVHDDIVIESSQRSLLKKDLAPFRDVIRSRRGENYFVLVSHGRYDALDDQHPASLSRFVITELLRKQLGFRGVIMTDDLEKGAIQKHYDIDVAAIMAVKAGVDLLLVSHNGEDVQKVVKALSAAVSQGEISEARINRSVTRIVRMKLANLEKPGTR